MFNPERLSLIVQPIGEGGIRFYSYPTDDTEATLTAAGYATNAADYGLRAYDLIFVTPVNGVEDTYILAVDAIDADGHATLTNPGPIGNIIGITSLAALQGRPLIDDAVYWMLGRTSVGDGAGGDFIGSTSDLSAQVLGSAIASSSVDAGTDTITTASAHGLMTGQAVVATSAVNGLSTNTLYYAIVDASVATPTTYQLATSFANAQAGTAIDLTGTSAVTVKQHYDPLMGIYVTPASDISGASGAWVRQLDGGRITARMFGAKGDNSTDDSHPWCAAADYMRARNNSGENITPVKLTGEGLFYAHDYSLNFTDLTSRGAAITDANFNSACADEIALDFTKSQFLHVDKIVVTGDQTTIPDAGMFWGRADDGGSLPFPTAQDNDIGIVETLGTFKKAGFINAASEVMHVDSLTASNAYYSAVSTSSIFAGHTDVIENFCGMPTSKYQKIGLGSQSLASVIIDNHNARRNPAYGYTITGISKANPAVVTISAANAADGAASYGLGNGTAVFLDSIVGSDAAWATLLSFKVFTVANFNAGAGTFELSGVDTSATTGTFTSGILRNDTGPSTLLGQVALYKEGGGYQTAYSDAHYRLDARGDNAGATDWNWNLVLSGRHETAADHLVKIIGNGHANIIRGLSIESDNSAARVSPISIAGVTGAGSIALYDLNVRLSHTAQTPTTGLFDDTSDVYLYGGRIVVPSSSYTNAKSGFLHSSARWEYGSGLVRDDGLGPLAQSAVAVSHTGDTVETTLATISIPAGFVGANDRIIIKMLWSFTGSTNVKTMKAKLNTTSFINQAVSGATQTSARYITEILARNSLNSQVGGAASLDGFTEIAAAVVTSTFNMANAQNITITGQLASAGETITLEAYSIEIVRF